MAFTALNSSEVASGEATRTELFTKIKDNFDDHESRLSDVEAFTASAQPFTFMIDGQGVVGDGKDYIRIPFGITVSGVKLFVKEAGLSGTVTVDVQRKVGAGAFASILSSTISSVYTDGDLFVVSASGIAISVIPAGSFLRLDIDAVQLGASGYDVIIEYTVTV